MCQINKKIKAHYYTIIRGYLTYRLALSIFIWSIWSRPFFTLRQNQKKKCGFFWGNEKKKICFWNCLTFKDSHKWYWKGQLHHCFWLLSSPKSESILFHGKLFANCSWNLSSKFCCFEEKSLLFRRIDEGQDSDLWGQSWVFIPTNYDQRWTQEVSGTQQNFHWPGWLAILSYSLWRSWSIMRNFSKLHNFLKYLIGLVTEKRI